MKKSPITKKLFKGTFMLIGAKTIITILCYKCPKYENISLTLGPSKVM